MSENPNDLYSGHSHSYDTGIATALGKNAAIVLNHITYWLRLNKLKGINLIEGKTWMYETQQEIANFLEYMTLDEVKNAILVLVKSGILIKGNFNKNAFDKTSWYTLSDQEKIGIKKILSKESYDSIEGVEELDRESSRTPSNESYDSFRKRPRTPSLYNKKNKEKHKEQQQDAAAFFDCLKDTPLLDSEKFLFSSQYPEEHLIQAVKWIATKKNVDNYPAYLTKGLQLLAKGEKLDAAKPTEEQAQDNKSKAIEIVSIAKLPNGVYVECLNQCIEVGMRGPYQPTCIAYAERGFEDQLKNAIRKWGGNFL